MATSEQIHNNAAHENSTVGIITSNVVEMTTLEPSTDTTVPSQTPVNTDSIAAATVTTLLPREDMAEAVPATTEPTPIHDPAPAIVSMSESSGAPLTMTPTALTSDGDASSTMKPMRSRFDSVAIGPASEAAPLTVTDQTNPVCMITLLLGSGARHPYKLDERYLTKRNVEVLGTTESGKKDPFSISVYTLKELILREWREEWEAKPSSPSSIRLIHFGRLLDDKMPLKECRFNADTPNVVHMSIKPQEMIDDEEAAKGKALRGEREGPERTPGCQCVIL